MIPSVVIAVALCAQEPSTGTVIEVPPSNAPATADAPLLVAVLDLRASPKVAGVAKALSTLLTAEVGARPGFKAVSRGELQSLLAHQSDARLLGCEEPQCLADIGKLANAERVIGGAVEQGEDGVVVFSLSLIDPAGPVILERLAWTWHSSPDDMTELARPAVDRLLFGAQSQAFTGSLEVLAPPGSIVFVDDKERGPAPILPLRELPIGVHKVEVRQPGYVTFTQDVAVAKGEPQLVRAELIDEASLVPWYARWYVWGGALAGAVVIGGAMAGVVAYNYLQTPSTLVIGGAK